MNGKTTYKGTISLLVCAFLFALAFVSFVSAQTGTAIVRGTVSDTQGKVIAGATVTLKNGGKNFSRTTTTDSNGAYTFTAIPPDVYVLEVEAQGFKKSVSTDQYLRQIM
jgi:protocatechuate 3,4-dioxygenase beta subunit